MSPHGLSGRSPLVTTAWLADHLEDPDVVVVDCRWYLAPFDTRDGAVEYGAGHVPGAVHLMWDTDLADPADPELAQLAGAERFAAVMAAVGIGDDTFVVVYDDRQVTVAARLWWALRYYGHDAVAVLDGGWQAWRAEGRPVAVGATSPRRTGAMFTPRPRPALYATKAEVLAALDDQATCLVDGRMAPAREADGGHLPGSVHLPGIEFSRPDGTWLSPEECRERIAAVTDLDAPRVVAYCRGGVGATGTALGFALAGRDDVAVYDGSWTEWARDPATPKAPLP